MTARGRRKERKGLFHMGQGDVRNGTGGIGGIEGGDKDIAIHPRDERVWALLREIPLAGREPSAGDEPGRIARDLIGRLGPSGEEPFRAVVRKAAGGDAFHVDILSGRPETVAELQILPADLRLRMNRPPIMDGAPEDPVLRLPEGAGAAGVEPGCILCDARVPAGQSDMFSLNVLWLGREPMYAGRTYRLSAAGREYAALVGKLKNRIDPETSLPLAARQLERGDVGQVEIEVNGNLVFDTHDVRSPFSVVVFRGEPDDEIRGIGIIRFALRRASNVRWQEMEIDKARRAAALGQKPLVLWFTGLSGCGKSTVASIVERKLHEMGRHTYVLDGDNVRHGLCRDLGFTRADRVENMRRVTEVARLMTDAGLIVLVTFISPFREERDRARKSFDGDEFVEVFVDTPLEICEARDEKGLYAKARAGLIPNFTGVDSPYEPPESPEIHLRGASLSPEEMAERVLEWLKARNLI